MANKTLDEAIVDAFKEINNYSTNGTPISTSQGNYIDLKNRMYSPCNVAIMELAKIQKIPAVMSIVQNPVDNQLGPTGFDTKLHLPGINDTFTGVGSKSFSFSFSSECTMQFDESINGVWTPISGTYITGTTTTPFTGSIVIPNTVTSFTNYKGLLTISSALNTVRVTIIATYPVTSKDRNLSAYAYPTAAKVPYYTAFVPYDLPTNYMDFNKMMRAFDTRQFQENADYQLVNQKIYLNWYLTGQFDIHYWQYPDPVTANTPGTTALQAQPDAQSLIPLYMGGKAIYPDDGNLGVLLLNEYENKKGKLTPTESKSNEVILDSSGW